MPQQDAGARNVIGLDAARQERVRAPQRGGDIARRVGELERDMANLVADLALQRYQQADAIASVRRESLREAEAPAALPSIDDIATAVAREVRVALRDEMRELLREIVA